MICKTTANRSSRHRKLPVPANVPAIWAEVRLGTGHVTHVDVGHIEPAHPECTTCHTSHGPTHVDRATCKTGCHTDRRNHQPEAVVCNGCHVFRT